MKKTAKMLLFIAIAVITNMSFAQTGKGMKFENDSSFADALVKAKTEGKNVFIDCYTTWCGPCKWMVKNVFPNDTVGEFFNSHFICISYDMETSIGKELARTYEVYCYPTYLFLDKDGNLLHRVSGAYPVKDFVKLGQDALNPEKQYASLEYVYKLGNITPSELVQYMRLRQASCLSVKQELEKYFNTQKEADYTNSINWLIIRDFGVDYKSPVFQYLLKSREEFCELHNADSVNIVCLSPYVNLVNKYIFGKVPDTTGYKNIRAELIALKLPSTERFILGMDLSFYGITQNWQQFSKIAVLHIEGYHYDSPEEINNIAYTFYEHINDTVLLKKALLWSECSLEIRPNFHYYVDTYACLLFKLGRKAEAEAMEEKAVELAKKDGNNLSLYKENLAKFKAKK